MGFKYNSVVAFKSENDVGLDRVPLGSIIQVTVQGVPSVYVYKDNTGVDNTTTITQAIAGTNIQEAAGSGGGITEFITAPTITAPTEGATGVTVGNAITTSAFTTPEGVIATHLYTDWEAATDVGFTTGLIQDTNSTDLLSHVMALLPSTTYYIRARHKSIEFVSAWSDAVSFSTEGVSVGTTTVSVTGGTTDVSEIPTFTTDIAFSITGSSETHTSTTWEVQTIAGGAVWSSVNDTNNLTSITMPAGVLTAGTGYKVRATYHTTSYNGAAGAFTSFSTIANFLATPAITGTVDGQEGQDVSISITGGLVAGATYTAVVSHGTPPSISSSPFTWTLPQVTGDTVVTIEVNYDKDGGTSANSNQLSGTVSDSGELADEGLLVTDFTIAVSETDGMTL